MAPAKQHHERTHHKDGPSSWPKIMACPCFESDGKAGDAAARGTRIHEAAEQLLEGRKVTVEGLNQKELDAAQWGVDYVQSVAPEYIESEIRVEAEVDTKHGQFSYFGWLDAYGDGHLFDFKSGSRRNYREQFAGYALPLMRERFLSEITFHIVFVDQREVEKLTYTLDEVEEIAKEVFTRKKDPNKKPTPCDYCSWCMHAATCPALVENIDKLAPHLEVEAASTDAVDSSLDLDTPEGRGRAYKAAKLLTQRCDALMKKIKDSEEDVAGYRYTPVVGKETVDIKLAYKVVGQKMGSDRFISACSISVNKLREVCQEYFDDVPAELEKLVTRGDGHLSLNPIKSPENK